MIDGELKKDITEDKISELSIEESLHQIEELLLKLESKDTSLEESIKLYTAGVELVKHAKEEIDGVEKKLRILNGEE